MVPYMRSPSGETPPPRSPASQVNARSAAEEGGDDDEQELDFAEFREVTPQPPSLPPPYRPPNPSLSPFAPPPFLTPP